MTFCSEVIHREIHRPHRLACGKLMRTCHQTRVFPRFRTMRAALHAHAEAAHLTAQPGTVGHSGLRNKPHSRSRAGYHSPVCSITGDAVDRIAAAIDQLASDAHDTKAGVSEDELTTRIATLWQMVSDLDPELARRAQRYTGPADGGPSV